MKLLLTEAARKRLEAAAGRLLTLLVMDVGTWLAWDCFAWNVHGMPLINPFQAAPLLLVLMAGNLAADTVRES